MKKYVLTMVALLLCLSMLACDVKPSLSETGGTAGADPSDGSWAGVDSGSDGIFSDDGYYYLTKDNCLCFLDVNNGINVVLCAKVGCPHDNSQFDANGETIYCEAYIPGELQCIWEGKVYYTIENDKGIFLHRRSADGSAEELVAQLCKERMDQDHAVTLSSMQFHEGIFYYQVNVQGISFGFNETLGMDTIIYDIEEKLLMRMDLRDRKEVCISATKGNTTPVLLGLHQEKLLYYLLIIDPAYYEIEKDDPNRQEKRDKYYAESSRQIILLDLASGEETVLIEKQFAEYFSVLDVSGDTLLYSVYEGGEPFMHSLNLATGKDTALREGEFHYINEDYCFRFEGEIENEKIVLVDMKTGQAMPTAYQDILIYPTAIGEDGVIMVRRVKPKGSSRTKSIHAYISFADLKDGLQETDFVDFFVE